MSIRLFRLLLIVLLLGLMMSCGETTTGGANAAAGPKSTMVPVDSTVPIEGPLVRVENVVFRVELALTVEQQAHGLSGRDLLMPGTGMLFVYQQENALSFWMKEMRFPLDIVWIGADCTVLDLTLEAPTPEPDQPLTQLPRFSPGGPAQYVLEINAGEAAVQGIETGNLVEFAGVLEGLYGC